MAPAFAKDESDWDRFCKCGRNEHDATEASHLCDDIIARLKAKDVKLNDVTIMLNVMDRRLRRLEIEIFPEPVRKSKALAKEAGQ